MFQHRRQAPLGNINLGNLSGPPSLEDMRYILEQATQCRGRFVEISWVFNKTGVSFQLTAKIMGTQPLPAWMLYRTIKGTSELIWGQNTSDLNLLHNLIALECEKPVDDTTATPAAARGSLSSSQHDTEPIVRSRITASGLSPVSTWLQNLASVQEASSQDASKPRTGTLTLGVLEELAGTNVPEDNLPGLSTLQETLVNGSLTNLSVPKLLGYIFENKLTGSLTLNSSAGSAEIFSQDGQLKHCVTLECSGADALLDVATWNEGEFQFNQGHRTAQESLQQETKV